MLQYVNPNDVLLNPNISAAFEKRSDAPFEGKDKKAEDVAPLKGSGAPSKHHDIGHEEEDEDEDEDEDQNEDEGEDSSSEEEAEDVAPLEGRGAPSEDHNMEDEEEDSSSEEEAENVAPLEGSVAQSGNQGMEDEEDEQEDEEDDDSSEKEVEGVAPLVRSGAPSENDEEEDDEEDEEDGEGTKEEDDASPERDPQNQGLTIRRKSVPFGPLEFACNFHNLENIQCGDIYSTEAEVEQHFESHLKFYRICPLCERKSQSYCRRQELQTHLEAAHRHGFTGEIDTRRLASRVFEEGKCYTCGVDRCRHECQNYPGQGLGGLGHPSSASQPKGPFRGIAPAPSTSQGEIQPGGQGVRYPVAAYERVYAGDVIQQPFPMGDTNHPGPGAAAASSMARIPASQVTTTPSWTQLRRKRFRCDFTNPVGQACGIFTTITNAAKTHAESHLATHRNCPECKAPTRGYEDPKTLTNHIDAIHVEIPFPEVRTIVKDLFALGKCGCGADLYRHRCPYGFAGPADRGAPQGNPASASGAIPEYVVVNRRGEDGQEHRKFHCNLLEVNGDQCGHVFDDEEVTRQHCYEVHHLGGTPCRFCNPVHKLCQGVFALCAYRKEPSRSPR